MTGFAAVAADHPAKLDQYVVARHGLPAFASTEPWCRVGWSHRWTLGVTVWRGYRQALASRLAGVR